MNVDQLKAYDSFSSIQQCHAARVHRHMRIQTNIPFSDKLLQVHKNIFFALSLCKVFIN